MSAHHMYNTKHKHNGTKISNKQDSLICQAPWSQLNGAKSNRREYKTDLSTDDLLINACVTGQT